MVFSTLHGKMVNGFRYYKALESVSMIASALSTALTIYPCQIRVHQRWQSKLPTSYSSEEGVVAGHSKQFTPCGYLSTLIHTTLVGLEPATFRSLARRATSRATEPAKYILIFSCPANWLYLVCSLRFSLLCVVFNSFVSVVHTIIPTKKYWTKRCPGTSRTEEITHNLTTSNPLETSFISGLLADFCLSVCSSHLCIVLKWQIKLSTRFLLRITGNQ